MPRMSKTPEESPCSSTVVLYHMFPRPPRVLLRSLVTWRCFLLRHSSSCSQVSQIAEFGERHPQQSRLVGGPLWRAVLHLPVIRAVALRRATGARLRAQLGRSGHLSVPVSVSSNHRRTSVGLVETSRFGKDCFSSPRVGIAARRPRGLSEQLDG